MTLKSDFANRLKLERKKLGFSSQAEIAEKCGVVKDVWGRYERGTSFPNVETLLLFMELGADIPFLFTGIEQNTHSDYPLYLSESELDLLYLFRNIQNKKTIFELLESVAYKQLNAPDENLLAELHSRREARRIARIEENFPERIFNNFEIAKKFKPRVDDLGGNWRLAMDFLSEKYPNGVKESELEGVFQELLKQIS